MLEVGNGWLNPEQERTHFALWAISKAPLILGCDLDKISSESLAIITNTEIIAVNQDPLGVQASCKVNCEYNSKEPYALLTDPQVYAAPLSNGDWAMVVVNWSPYEYK